MHATWRCSLRSTACLARAKAPRPLPSGPLPAGIRQGRRPTVELDPELTEKADRGLEGAIASHKSALDAVTRRSGGALFHGTILDPQALRGGRPLGKILPGDFVEVQSHQAVRGIALPVVQDGKKTMDERRSAILVPSGEIKFLSLEDTVITFPAFVDADIVRQATVNVATPDETSPDERSQLKLGDLEVVLDLKALSARAQICATLRSLLRRTEQQQWTLSRHFEERYLSQLQEGLTIEQRLISVPEMAKQLLEDSGKSPEEVEQESQSPATLLAVHGLLIGAPDIFHMDPINHRSTLTFLMQSAEEQRACKAVEGMVREALELQGRRAANVSSLPSSGGGLGESAIASFASRVKKAIRDRKKVYKGLGSTNGPPVIIGTGDAEATAVPPIIPWTDNDKVIITFLRSAFGVRRTFKSESTAQVQNYILKECGYEYEMTPDTLGAAPGPVLETIASRKAAIARMFRELGLISPWERLSSFENEFEERIEQPYPKVPDTLEWENDEYMRSQVDETVYVIDDGNAQELDDGLSIERTQDPGQVWLHIHIADPTAALRPTDNIATAARQRYSSVYYAERSYPMLPHDFVAPIGLQAKADGDGLPLLRAMTFSAKVKLDSGSVTDVNVGLSYLRRTRVMSYEDATSVMLNEAQGVDEQTTKDLKLLRDTTGALERRRRLKCGAFYFTTAKPKVIVSPKTLPASSLRQYPEPLSFDTPMYSGFPSIEVQGFEPESIGGPYVSGARGAVSEAAMTACMIAAQWSKEHNVPTIYRGQSSTSSPQVLETFLARRDANGIVDFADVAQAQLVTEGATLSSQPMEHLSLGVRTALGLSHRCSGGDQDVLLAAGYARTTSPLRRFSDMIAHWQLRHALKLQHPKHEPAASSARYPWSLEHLLMLIPRVGRMESWHNTLNRGHSSWWLVLKLHRTMLARRLAGLPGGGSAPVDRTMTDYGLTALGDSLNDQQAAQIIDGVHDASITLGDIRRLPNGELRVIVLVRALNISAQLIWPSHTAPRIGETYKVRIVDINWSGGTSTTTVQRA